MLDRIALSRFISCNKKEARLSRRRARVLAYFVRGEENVEFNALIRLHS